MLNLIKGQVLEVKDEYINKFDYDAYTVILIVEGGVLIGKTSRLWYTDEELAKYFEIPKEKWKPKEGEWHWYVTSILSLDCTIWRDGDSVDNVRLQIGNVFPTKEAAEAAAEKIKALLKSL